MKTFEDNPWIEHFFLKWIQPSYQKSNRYKKKSTLIKPDGFFGLQFSSSEKYFYASFFGKIKQEILCNQHITMIIHNGK